MHCFVINAQIVIDSYSSLLVTSGIVLMRPCLLFHYKDFLEKGYFIRHRTWFQVRPTKG